jgi:DNA-binding helix-hairpin-helix protein with protein kinase domain
MFIQGDLQSVFDALFYLGVIDPVLNSDWDKALNDFKNHSSEVKEAIELANRSNGDIKKLIEGLGQYESQTLEYVAMEVAREYANFHSRDEALH